MTRLSGFHAQVDRFYALPKGELESNKFQPQHIYNADKSGITTVQTPGKILFNKGIKQVGCIDSVEKGVTTTIVCAMSAVGHFVPTLLI